MPEIIKGKQLSDEWFRLRCGSVGGSKISTVQAKGKQKKDGTHSVSKTRQSLLYQYASEIITGIKHKEYSNKNMKDGTTLEPKALEAFKYIKSLNVNTVSLIKGPIKYTHYSPDGLPEDNSLLEIKCRTSPVHAQHLDENRTPPDAVKQIQWGLGISECDHCWYFSYHPTMKPLLIKVFPDKKMFANMMIDAKIFIHEMLELVERIK